MTDAKKVRLDKWLWAARFFKTRSQAAQAVSGGKVHLNGARSKPSRIIDIGDELQIQRGGYEFVVTVRGISSYRRPAVEARLLYEETEESRLRREETREQRWLVNLEQMSPLKKPSKKDRRLIRKFTRKG